MTGINKQQSRPSGPPQFATSPIPDLRPRCTVDMSELQRSLFSRPTASVKVFIMSLNAQAFQRACRSRLLSQPPHITLSSSPALEILSQRRHATQSTLGTSPSSSSTTRRKAITVTGDDGRVSWGDLSNREKAARTTQQTFNFTIVAAGAVGTLLVAYFLYQELFAADSKTRLFNAAVDRVKADSRCIELLGRPAKKIKAYGEPTTNKWARARPLAYTKYVDEKTGLEDYRMHFHVEGTEDQGVVNVHMTRPNGGELRYEVLRSERQGQGGRLPGEQS